MERALYGPEGFFVAGAGPAAHFRTTAHAAPVLAACILRLLSELDAALGHPPVLSVVDVGAGRGELLRGLLSAVGELQVVGVSGEPARSGRSGLIPARAGSPETPTTTAAVGTAPSPEPVTAAGLPLADRVRLVAVEKAPRPDDLPPEIDWLAEIPDRITGLLIATEWLDNVPLDLAAHTADGWRYLLVDPTTGEESTGEPLSTGDAHWLTRWWPSGAAGSSAATPDDSAGSDATGPTTSGFGAEIGRTRDEAWAGAVGRVERGLAVAVDYGHLRDSRPFDGTLTGYRAGRQVAPVPDGSCDVTAHVAMDSAASAGERVARCAYSLVFQREALRALGADGGRPPIALAGRDPAGYVRALAAASTVAELTDPAGLGGHRWLLQPVGIGALPVMARWRA
ncbi:SAM-dependent methyltransferase [Micromonospora mirobrigensis]|uniref:SAM-dependent methyltransferase, MidA family n=1 Tax=Micromonospora mirobrigensis TaxID=262898 RepID=A0A1C4ZQN0_9ACTN|nr:SAM-dependent methyltransferase [Micromonospora mirobrigensis]SCF35106.1 SAM-dependent methyltransferase, MidA family [Micromonospora mirobrigensis]